MYFKVKLLWNPVNC